MTGTGGQQYSFTTFDSPYGGCNFGGIAAGPDGNLWVIDGLGMVARVTVAGEFSRFKIPWSSWPRKIAAGPDGHLWFSTHGDSSIGRVSVSGEVTQFALAAFDAAPDALTAGPDGNVWFTKWRPPGVARISSDGEVVDVGALAVGSVPVGIVAGPDGNLWIADGKGDSISRMTVSGEVTTYPIPTAGADPWQVTVGPDGNLWFTEYGGHKIGRITPQGSMTEFPLKNPVHSAVDIVAGLGADLWFLEVTDGVTPNVYQQGYNLVRMTLDGEMTTFSVPVEAGDRIYQITIGSDRNIWMPDVGGTTPCGVIRFTL